MLDCKLIQRLFGSAVKVRGIEDGLSARNGFTKVGSQLKTGVSGKHDVAQEWLWLNRTVADLWQTVAKADFLSFEV